jgi:hypothetical protein
MNSIGEEPLKQCILAVSIWIAFLTTFLLCERSFGRLFSVSLVVQRQQAAQHFFAGGWADRITDAVVLRQRLDLVEIVA